MRVASRTLISLALCAAAAAAAAAHFLIDVVGDFALRHDTYDHLRHGSRSLVTIVALGLAAGLAARGLGACCDIGARNRVRAVAIKFDLPDTVAFFVGVVALVAVLVPAMEIFDARAAGLGFGSLGDAFGGSLLVGVATAVACASAAAASLYAMARWLCAQRDSITAMFATLLRRRGEPPVPSSLVERPIFVALRRRTPHAPQLAKRGPPEVLFA